MNIQRNIKNYLYCLLILLAAFSSQTYATTENASAVEVIDEPDQDKSKGTSSLQDTATAEASSTVAAEEEESLPPKPEEIAREGKLKEFLLLFGVLAFVALLLLFISITLGNLLRIKEGKAPLSLKRTLQTTFESLKNPYIAITATLVVTVLASVLVLIPEGRSVGLHQGYQPKQPVKFPHTRHAGLEADGGLEIDCQYCHFSASTSKNAAIPSLNICMNCHAGVQEVENDPWATKEIEKVITAYEENRPIEWVRIHNLHDLAYFNHQQHVVAGKIECQQCHGEVQEMEEVYQFSSLSMGWCVDCHRKTQVDTTYYHNVLGRDNVLTVEDIGGLNCARCHY